MSLPFASQIETADMLRYTDLVMSWLRAGNRHPFVVVGPDGSGKSMLLYHCFEKQRSTQVMFAQFLLDCCPVSQMASKLYGLKRKHFRRKVHARENLISLFLLTGQLMVAEASNIPIAKQALVTMVASISTAVTNDVTEYQ